MKFYEMKAKNIDGQEVSMADYRGKVLLVVNTASKCGFTPQLEDLQALYESYKDKNFEVIGFPCNQFMEQEPGDSQAIKSFCSLNYGVTFPMFDKIEVNGKNEHPIYSYLKAEAPFKGLDMTNTTNKLLDSMLKEKFLEFTIGNAIRWNFTKFLIDRSGRVVERFESSVEPMDIKSQIEALL